MSAISQAIQYVASLDPRFPAGIRGASEAEIGGLERLAGPLPADYREFLLTMGRSMDWISVQRAAFDIPAVAGLLQEAASRVPPGYLPIAVPRLDATHPIFLNSGRVVTFPLPYEGESVEPEEIVAVAGSLHEMICTRAFRTVRMNLMPLGIRLYQKTGGTAQPMEVPAALDLAPEWFSNDWVAVMAGEGSAAVAQRGPNSVLVVDCAAADSMMLSYMAHQLQSRFGMVELKVNGIWRDG